MLVSTFLLASVLGLPAKRQSHSTHSTITNSKWRPLSGTTSTTHTTKSHSSGTNLDSSSHFHSSPVVDSHISGSSGFNWAHAAVGAGVGIGASTLLNQHEQINQLQEQVDRGVSAPSSVVIAAPMPVVSTSSNANDVFAQQPVSGSGSIHSEKGQDLILNTDDGPKIFEQKN